MVPIAWRQPQPWQVLIVDDHPIFRHGMRRLLEEDRSFIVCGEAADVTSGFKEVSEKSPHIVLVDISLDDSNGLDLIKMIHLRYPQITSIVLSMYREALYAERALHAGARGYLMKQEPASQLVQAIKRIVQGEIYVSDTLGGRLLDKIASGKPLYASPVECLSNRELEVFQLIGQGRGTRQIAQSLHLSIKTIESYRAHIKTKLNLTNGTELIQRAAQWSHAEKIS